MEGDGCYVAKLKWLAINGFPEIVATITCFTFLIRVKIAFFETTCSLVFGLNSVRIIQAKTQAIDSLQSCNRQLIHGLDPCLHTVDGRNPKQPPGMEKNLQIMG